VSYLPVDMVHEAWTTVVKEKVNEMMTTIDPDWEDEVVAFVGYVSRTWIGDVNPRTGMNMTQPRSPPHDLT